MRCGSACSGESTLIRGQRDEAFGRDLQWAHTSMLCSYERGNRDDQLHEMSADEAMAIADRIRRAVAASR